MARKKLRWSGTGSFLAGVLLFVALQTMPIQWASAQIPSTNPDPAHVDDTDLNNIQVTDTGVDDSDNLSYALNHVAPGGTVSLVSPGPYFVKRMILVHNFDGHWVGLGRDLTEVVAKDFSPLTDAEAQENGIRGFKVPVAFHFFEKQVNGVSRPTNLEMSDFTLRAEGPGVPWHFPPTGPASPPNINSLYALVFVQGENPFWDLPLVLVPDPLGRTLSVLNGAADPDALHISHVDVKIHDMRFAGEDNPSLPGGTNAYFGVQIIGGRTRQGADNGLSLELAYADKPLTGTSLVYDNIFENFLRNGYEELVRTGATLNDIVGQAPFTYERPGAVGKVVLEDNLFRNVGTLAIEDNASAVFLGFSSNDAIYEVIDNRFVDCRGINILAVGGGGFSIFGLGGVVFPWFPLEKPTHFQIEDNQFERDTALTYTGAPTTEIFSAAVIVLFDALTVGFPLGPGLKGTDANIVGNTINMTTPPGTINPLAISSSGASDVVIRDNNISGSGAAAIEAGTLFPALFGPLLPFFPGLLDEADRNLSISDNQIAFAPFLNLNAIFFSLPGDIVLGASAHDSLIFDNLYDLTFVPGWPSGQGAVLLQGDNNTLVESLPPDQVLDLGTGNTVLLDVAP